jgi:hypothetical protein
VPAPTDGSERDSVRLRARFGAIVAIILAVVAGIWLVVWPCFYTGITTVADPDGVGPGPSGDATTCSSLIAENGSWVLNLLAVPVILTVLAFLAVVARLRGVTWTLALLFLALCVLAAWSIGVFYVPSAVALLIGATGMRRRAATESVSGSSRESVGGR